MKLATGDRSQTVGIGRDSRTAAVGLAVLGRRGEVKGWRMVLGGLERDGYRKIRLKRL